MNLFATYLVGRPQDYKTNWVNISSSTAHV